MVHGFRGWVSDGGVKFGEGDVDLGFRVKDFSLGDGLTGLEVWRPAAISNPTKAAGKTCSQYGGFPKIRIPFWGSL